MYEVIKKDSGERIAICEKPRYVKLNEQSGAFIQCSKDEAEGIAISSAVYKLKDNAEVSINEIDSGEFILAVNDQAKELLEIKAALCDLDLAGGE